MTHREAAIILNSLALRQSAQFADIVEHGDADARALLASSGELEVVEAMRLGAKALVFRALAGREEE